MSEGACAFVELVLLASLPPNVPPSFTEVTTGHFIGLGRKRFAVANVIMFDGLPASVKCWRYDNDEGLHGWAHQWLELTGGNISWNGTKWERVQESN